MIQGRLNNGAFIFGMDSENVRRLVAGQPIVLRLARLGGTDTVFLIFGETMEAILRDLERELGALPAPTAPPPERLQ